MQETVQVSIGTVCTDLNCQVICTQINLQSILCMAVFCVKGVICQFAKFIFALEFRVLFALGGTSCRLYSCNLKSLITNWQQHSESSCNHWMSLDSSVVIFNICGMWYTQYMWYAVHSSTWQQSSMLALVRTCQIESSPMNRRLISLVAWTQGLLNCQTARIQSHLTTN